MTEDATADRTAELEADNARLRRLLDAQNAPGELRHRLQSTLALLRAVIRESAKSKDEVEAYAAHLEDRLDAIVRAQRTADEIGEVGLASIVAGELHQYGALEGDQVTLAGPDVLFQPRAAQLVTLAMHELAVNAVEHGPLMAREGRVAVTWQVEAGAPDAVLTLTWRESGPEPLAEAARQGFGTTVLTSLLRYELKAGTKLDFGRDGLRYTLAFPLAERVGRVGREEPI